MRQSKSRTIEFKQWITSWAAEMKNQGHGQDGALFPDKRLEKAMKMLSPGYLYCLMEDMKLLIKYQNVPIWSLNKFVTRMVTKIQSQWEEENIPLASSHQEASRSSVLPSPSHPQPTTSYKTPSEFPSTPRVLPVSHQPDSYLAAATAPTTRHSVGHAVTTTTTAGALDFSSGDYAASSSNDNGESTNLATMMISRSPLNHTAPLYQPSDQIVWWKKKEIPISQPAQASSPSLFPGLLNWLKCDESIYDPNYQFDSNPYDDPGLGCHPEDIVAWIFRE
jgi:hypothetical protein